MSPAFCAKTALIILIAHRPQRPRAFPCDAAAALEARSADGAAACAGPNLSSVLARRLLPKRCGRNAKDHAQPPKIGCPAGGCAARHGRDTPAAPPSRWANAPAATAPARIQTGRPLRWGDDPPVSRPLYHRSVCARQQKGLSFLGLFHPARRPARRPRCLGKSAGRARRHAFCVGGRSAASLPA